MFTYIRIIIVAAFLGLAQSAVAQSGLPPKVQADLLLEEIAEQIREKDFDAALVNLIHYDAVVFNEGTLEFPPPLRLTWAKLLFTTGQYYDSSVQLGRYFRDAPQEGDAYREALALHKAIEKTTDELYKKAIFYIDQNLENWLEIELALRDIDFFRKDGGYLKFCNRQSQRSFGFVIPLLSDLSKSWDFLRRNKVFAANTDPYWPFSFVYTDKREYVFDIKGIESIDQRTWVLTTDFDENYSSFKSYYNVNESETWLFKTAKGGFSVTVGPDDNETIYSRDDCPDSPFS